MNFPGSGLEKVGWLSALPAGLGHNGGDVLLHLGTFALRTDDFGCTMFGNPLYHGEFLAAVPAFILVGRHIPPPWFLDRLVSGEKGV
jgi:hypothetical protein